MRWRPTVAATSSSPVQRVALYLPFASNAPQRKLLAALAETMDGNAPSAELIKIEPRLGGGWRLHVDLYLDDDTNPQDFVESFYGDTTCGPYEAYTAGVTDWADV